MHGRGRAAPDSHHLKDTTMTTASDIMNNSRNANDACTRAAGAARKLEQDWENEATRYTFEDGSVLAVSGPQVNAFDSMRDLLRHHHD
jgi:hypothetical protein